MRAVAAGNPGGGAASLIRIKFLAVQQD